MANSGGEEVTVTGQVTSRCETDRQCIVVIFRHPAGAGWGAGSWLCDLCSLWVFLAAYGHRVNPLGLLVACGPANLLATVPISPGGLGVVEGVLILFLVGFGTP